MLRQHGYHLMEWHLPYDCHLAGGQYIERRPPCLDECEYSTHYWEPEKGAYFWTVYNGAGDPMDMGTTRTFLGSLFSILLSLRAAERDYFPELRGRRA